VRLLLSALTVLTLAGCAGSTEGSTSTSVPVTSVPSSDSTIAPTTQTMAPPPNQWPSQMENNYLVACRRGTEASAGASISPLSVDLYCTCTLERLQRKFTAEEFTEAEVKFMRRDASGLDMREIASGCNLGSA